MNSPEKEKREQEIYESFFAESDHLKSLRPQQNPAWSEEDKKMLDEVLDRVTYAFYNQGKEGEIEDDPAFLWLHRLRPSWKPSEEQMDSLRDTIVQTKGYSYSMYLPELYEQLKKLI